MSEAGMVGKWVELLKEIAPAIERVVIMFNPAHRTCRWKRFPGLVQVSLPRSLY